MRRGGWCGPHEGGRARHYNAALQVSELADGLTSVVWTADFLPDDIGGYHVAGDRSGDGGDAAVAGRAGGIAKDVDAQRRKTMRELCVWTDSRLP